MNYHLHPAAEREADDAAGWYGERVPALGIEFARQYALAVDWIAAHPRMYPPAEDAPPDVECRNLTHLGRFPYRVIYALVDGEIYLVAVAHHSRKPEYWHDRLPEAAP